MDYKNIETSPSMTAKVVLGLKELKDEWVCQYAAKRIEELEQEVEGLRKLFIELGAEINKVINITGQAFEKDETL